MDAQEDIVRVPHAQHGAFNPANAFVRMGKER
jgi:hypothetical protein